MADTTSVPVAAAQSVVTTDQLPNLFISACLDGEAQAVVGGGTPIEFGALPSALRGHLGKPDKAQVWMIDGAEPAYLYALSYTDRSFSPKICGVASENLSIRPAAAAVELRLTGRNVLNPTPSKSTEWLNDEVGYRALATRKGGYTILQVNWLNENQTEAPPTQ